MTVRAVVAAWFAVAVLLIAAAAAMTVAAGPAPPTFHRAPVAVIGSSLLHNAVPNQGDDRGGLLGDGRAHWRVGINAITQDDTALLLGHALDEHAKVALVEANVLLFDIARTRADRRCDQPAAGLRRAIKFLQLDITDVYARLFGKARELDEDAGIKEFETSLPLSVQRRGIYPLAVRGPCDRAMLESLAARARAQGTSIVLLVPPRSASSDHLLGPGQKRLIAADAQELAKMMGAAVFNPGTPWPDAEFVDGEHVNRAGRAHFIAALRHWWMAQN